MTAPKNAVVLEEYQQSDEWDLIGLYNRQRLVFERVTNRRKFQISDIKYHNVITLVVVLVVVVTNGPNKPDTG